MLIRTLRKLGTRMRGLGRCQRGISAVEFALLTPVIVVGGLSTVDAGIAIYDKMMINQILRSGAHSAIAAKSEAAVLAILEATAADNFTVANGDPQPGELSVDVDSYCTCPEAMGTDVGCTSSCSGGVSPRQFYQLSAAVTRDNVMLPNIDLSGTIDVIAN